MPNSNDDDDDDDDDDSDRTAKSDRTTTPRDNTHRLMTAHAI
jgi:hypothetical protein